MGMTMTQKILAAHAGRATVRPGEILEARVDLVLGNDITAPVAIQEFSRIGLPRVFDRRRVVLVPDHFAPNKDIKAAEQCRLMREFAREHGIINYFEVGEMGIEHVLLPEKGLVVAGDAVVGADSHTCTYGALGAFATGVGSTDMAVAMATGKCWFRVPRAILFELKGRPARHVAGKDVILHIIGLIGVDGANYRSMEFCGTGLRHLSMDSRLTMANMAIEGGAKNGIFPVDEVCSDYLNARADRAARVFEPDDDAEYERVLEIDLGRIPPTVACPHLPANTRPAAELGHVAVDQVVIGSCTNGRMEDLRAAAALLKGRRVAPGARTIVIPGTQEIYMQALKEGLIEIFVAAGAAVSTPTCGPCLGGHMGVLARGEKALATTNRNFRGRMGHAESEIYLAGPAVAAATAITGQITDPSMIGDVGEPGPRPRSRRGRSRKGAGREN
jgi:3-isopropylmalate/(R)-2-methylmalate dehydratase large subunit